MAKIYMIQSNIKNKPHRHITMLRYKRLTIGRVLISVKYFSDTSIVIESIFEPILVHILSILRTSFGDMYANFDNTVDH
jgi:hypothetical protein